MPLATNSSRREFIKTLGMVTAGAALAPFLLPACKECGARMLIELLAGDTELCATCRGKHRTVHAVSIDLVQASSGYTTVTQLNTLFKKTHEGILQSLRQQTSEMDWFRSYPMQPDRMIVSRGVYTDMIAWTQQNDPHIWATI